MANTKIRHKTKNKDDKSTGKRIKKTMRLEEHEQLKFLSHEERIQYLVRNGHLIKDKKFNDAAWKKNLEKEVQVRKLRNDKLISKGKLKNRNKHIKFMDSILMSELLIKQAPGCDKKKARKDNNNDNELTDQNKSDHSKSKQKNSEKSIGETQNNDEIIDIDTDEAISCIDVGQTKVQNEAKSKQRQSISKKQNEDIDMVESVDTNNSVTDTNSNNVDTNKAKDNRKNSILTERLEEMKIVKLSNGISLSMAYYQCDHCQTQFCSKSSLQRHMLMHMNLKPYKCPECPNRKFRQRGNWGAHIRRRHPQAFKNIKYDCKSCKKPFMSLKDLKSHKKEHATETQKQYTCVFCEKVFIDKALLAIHEKHHMAPGKYKCSMCSMSYNSRVLYSDHLKSHAKVEDYSCQYCGKSYLRPSSIARHIRVSHGGMRMQCPVCNKLLKGHLTEHMRTHENDRPHECDVCGQRFTQSTQLTVHKRSHTGARPYPCRICKQPFSHSNALMLHIRRHTGEKPFECAMCPQTFSQLPHMKAHMRSIHSKTEFYKCTKCSTFFKLKASLEAHAQECGASESLKKTENKHSTLVSKMRFHLALLFTMIASKEKLNDLGFNKRLIDDILVDSIEAMGLAPCKNKSMPPFSRLKINALMLLQGTVPKPQMALFVKEKKTTEEILELLTDDLNK